MATDPFRDVAEYSIWCPRKEYWLPLLRCPQCRNYPCAQLNQKNINDLETSLFTDKFIVSLIPEKVKMYIFKMLDGTLQYAPENFNPDSFEPEILENVQEVYCISKTLIKQMKLVVKRREEMEKVRASKKTGKSAQ